MKTHELIDILMSCDRDIDVMIAGHPVTSFEVVRQENNEPAYFDIVGQ